MNFEKLKRRVERSEALVSGRAQQTHEAYGDLKSTWRASWTPTRIVIAGLLSGFIVGRSEPSRAIKKIGKLGGPRWIQLISAVSGMVTSLQAAMAAAAATSAASSTDAAADDVAEAADQIDDIATGPDDIAGAQPADTSVSPSMDRRRPDPVYSAQPRPAEAATEISER